MCFKPRTGKPSLWRQQYKLLTGVWMVLAMQASFFGLLSCGSTVAEYIINDLVNKALGEQEGPIGAQSSALVPYNPNNITMRQLQVWIIRTTTQGIGRFIHKTTRFSTAASAANLICAGIVFAKNK